MDAKNRWWVSTNCSWSRRVSKNHGRKGQGETGLTLSPSEMSPCCLLHLSIHPPTELLLCTRPCSSFYWVYENEKEDSVVLRKLPDSKDTWSQKPRNLCQLDPVENLRVVWFPALSTGRDLSWVSPELETIWICMHKMPTFISPLQFLGLGFAFGTQNILAISTTNTNHLFIYF